MTQLIDFTVIAILIAGIWQFREPRRAKHGNLTAALALFLACILILYRNGIFDVGIVMASLLVGGVVGAYYARTVSMIQVPAMVAFQHGVGGVAAVLVSLVELSRAPHALNLASEISGILGLAIGSLTFSGSMIASAKLANKMRQAAQVLRSHRLLVLANVEALMAVGMASFWLPAGAALCLYLLEIVFGICFGISLAIRIGGADMPVLISSLNATAGIAAALCGMALENQLLIAFGATVASSGSILTYVMCKAMNRRMVKVIFPDYAPARATPAAGSEAVTSRAQSVQNPGPTDSADGFSKALSAIRAAHSAIIVPGYGMALANAQQEVVSLANALSAKG